MNISTFLFSIFLILKLCNVIDWSWWWVCSPLWIGLLMPHQIRITNVRVEHLQDISDDDCIKEGVVENINRYYPCQFLKDCAAELGWGLTYATPQIAYAILIDRTSGNGTWKSNPIVFVYDFELVK